MPPKDISYKNLDLTVKREAIGMPNAVPIAIRYNFNGEIFLSDQDSKTIKGYVEKIQPKCGLSAKLNDQKLIYTVDFKFRLNELNDFSESDFIEEKFDFIRDKIQEHFNLLLISIDRINKLKRDEEITATRQIKITK